MSSSRVRELRRAAAWLPRSRLRRSSDGRPRRSSDGREDLAASSEDRAASTAVRAMSRDVPRPAASKEPGRLPSTLVSTTSSTAAAVIRPISRVDTPPLSSAAARPNAAVRRASAAGLCASFELRRSARRACRLAWMRALRRASNISASSSWRPPRSTKSRMLLHRHTRLRRSCGGAIMSPCETLRMASSSTSTCTDSNSFSGTARRMRL
mmetsp:Transcript_8946/g.29598  ORF Transcript_8946/g.29598 Transcript_8946/m.29598 type:complete len:210 (+) Transcript_8946:839-1468(+)